MAMESGTYDGRVDVWSLGITCYEMGAWHWLSPIPLLCNYCIKPLSSLLYRPISNRNIIVERYRSSTTPAIASEGITFVTSNTSKFQVTPTAAISELLVVSSLVIASL